MLANPNRIPTNYNFYQNKLIRIISPFSGEQFKIELGGKEEEFRELLATLLNIEPSYIKGLKDSFGNYYTLSSALNDIFIFSNENNIFSLVLNISNKNKSKYNYYPESFDKNMLYNVNNNYHNRTEYNEIYIGHSNSNKNLMRKKTNYRYTTLIKQLIPAINRNYRDEDENDNENESFYDEKWSLNKHPKFEKVLKNIKNNFSNEQYKILKELLKMENITIINCFKLYEKSKDKKSLIKELKSLSKKYQKKITNNSSSNNEDSSIEITSKQNKKSKKNKRHSESNISSEPEKSSKHYKKSSQHRKKSQSSSTSSEKKSESKSKSRNSKSKSINSPSSEENNDEEEEKIDFPIKCSSLEEVIETIKDISNDDIVLNCLFSNDIDFMKKTENQKIALIKDEFGIKNNTITEENYEYIKSYYDNIMKKVVEKDMTEDEKQYLHKLIKKKNRTLILRFKAILRHKNYDCLTQDLKECIKDIIKRKKDNENKIDINNRDSFTINTNSNSSDDNEVRGDQNYGMDDSSKSIRKNERLAKKVKKKNKKKSEKSNDDESKGQFQLLKLNEGTKDDSASNSKKSEITKSRKSSSKIAKEKEEENMEIDFIPLINKLQKGNLDITNNEVNILIKEFKAKNETLLSFLDMYKSEPDDDELIENLGILINDLYKSKKYIKGETVELSDNENDNEETKENNSLYNKKEEEELPYEKEIIEALSSLKFSDKGNKKIINILINNNAFTKDQMRIIENDLEQNANFITGSFELVYITMNVKDLVENINIRLQLSQSEKENQIKTNLEIIMKSFTEEKQNKVKELYEAKDENLMYILESEMNDIKKAKTSILNLLGKN